MATTDIRGATLSAADPPIATNPNPDLAIKAPVRVATTGSNITLSGLQTIDGVALAAGDRVLVKDETDQTANGLYNAATGLWTRTIDGNNNSQWAQGVEVNVAQGTVNGSTPFTCTTANPIILGTSLLTFQGSFNSSIAANSITNAKLAQAGALTFKGNVTTSTGNETDNALIGVNPVWFGADPTGASDSTAALNSALASSNYVIFPPGKFKFLSAISYALSSGIKSVTIAGAGQDATELTWPNASGGITFNYSGLGSSAHVRDLTLTTGTTAGGDAIKLSLAASLANPALTAMSDLTRVTMRGSDGYGQTNYWTNDVNVANVSNINFDGVEMCGSSGQLGNAVKLLGLPGSSTYGVQYNFDKCTFESLATGITYGSFVQGVAVDMCNFTAVTQCIVSPAAQTGTLAQLSITNSQFNPTGASANAIITNTAIFDVQITNNLFIVGQNSTNAINLAANNHFAIVGNEIASLNSSTSINGIIIGPSSASGSGVISGNDILNFTNGVQIQTGALTTSVIGNTITGGAGTTPIVIQASVASLKVEGNNLIGPSTTISNSSTSQTNSIINNQGYNPVGPSAITVGASPFTYTAGPSPETVYILNGTVSGVNVDKNGGAFAGGSAAFGQTNCAVDLGPNEQVKVAYSVLPTMNKMVH